MDDILYVTTQDNKIVGARHWSGCTNLVLTDLSWVFSIFNDLKTIIHFISKRGFDYKYKSKFPWTANSLKILYILHTFLYTIHYYIIYTWFRLKYKYYGLYNTFLMTAHKITCFCWCKILNHLQILPTRAKLLIGYLAPHLALDAEPPHYCYHQGHRFF